MTHLVEQVGGEIRQDRHNHQWSNDPLELITVRELHHHVGREGRGHRNQQLFERLKVWNGREKGGGGGG